MLCSPTLGCGSHVQGIAKKIKQMEVDLSSYEREPLLFDLRLALNAEQGASSLCRNCHRRSQQTTERNSSRMPRREGSHKVAVTNRTGSKAKIHEL